MIPNVIPTVHRQNTFIAGGYAACPALATDMDLWVTTDDLDATRKNLIGHFKLQHVYRVTVEDSRDSNPGYIPDSTFQTRKVALLENKVTGQKIHVLVTTGEVHDVLGAFDISTHQVAIMPDGQVIKGPNFTPVNQEPYVIRDGETTNERLEKITRRFAWPDMAFARSARPISRFGRDGNPSDEAPF